MTLQYRMSESDRRLYNPVRDVAHNVADVLKYTAGRLDDKAWPELDQMMQQLNVTQRQLEEAWAAYCDFVASAREQQEEQLTPMQAVERAGFLDCAPGAQIAVLAMIGTTYMGIAFNGVREATLADEGPMYTVRQLFQAAEEIREAMDVPLWRRRLRKGFRQKLEKLKKWFRKDSDDRE